MRGKTNDSKWEFGFASHPVLRIVIPYIFVAGLWIVASDFVLSQQLQSGEDQFFVSVLKGLVFVGVTATLIASLLTREHRRLYRRTARQIKTTSALLEHFRALASRVSDIVLLADENGRIVEANDAAVAALGWSHAVLAERRIQDLEVTSGAETSERLKSYESLFRMADGRLLPVQVDVLSLHVGMHVFRQFLVRDASRQQSSVQRQRDRSWIDVFFDMPFIGMAITSPKTKGWLRFNDRLCEILGYPRAELAQLSWADVTHPNDLEKDVKEFNRALRGETDTYRMEKRFLRKNGDVIHAEIDVRCRRLPDGVVDYFVATVQDISSRIEGEERLLRQRNLYAALSQINTAITRLPSRAEVFQDVCDAAAGIGRFKFAWIFSVGQGENEYRFEAQAGDDSGFIAGLLEAAAAGVDFRLTVPAEAIRKKRSVVCDPYMQDPLTDGFRELAASAGVAASAAVPILQHEQVIAVLNIYSDRTGDFDRDVIALFEEMARDVSFAIENRRREENRVEAHKALEAAEIRSRFALEGAGHGAWEWDLTSGRVHYASLWKRMLGYEDSEISDSPREWSGRIHPDDRRRARIELQKHLSGETRSYICEHRLRCKDGSYRWVLDRGQVLERDEHGQPLKIFGTKTDITELKKSQEALRLERHRMDMARTSAQVGTWDYDVGLELLHLHRYTPTLFGLAETPTSLSKEEFLELVHDEDRGELRRRIEARLAEGGEDVWQFRCIWPDGSLHWVEVRAALQSKAGGDPGAAFGIFMDITQRVAAEQQIRDYVHRLEGAMLGTVDAISRMVDLRDPYTAGHQVKVGQLAEAIGLELGMDPGYCKGLSIIGRVHDIGKITVPAEILAKPGRLTEMEMEIVRTHAEQGYEILKGVEFDWPVAEAIRQHHERMDGSGYPRGLAGSEILLEARIIAVADVIESMSSHRPYRPSLGVELALAEIESKAGLHYDEAVAGACLRLFRERGFVFAGRE